MDFKKQLLEIIENLKNIGFSRRDIEAEVGYKNKYLDQILSKGGNDKVIKRLNDFYKEKMNERTSKVDLNQALSEMLARIQRLEDIVSVLKDDDVYLVSKIDGKKISVASADLEAAILRVSKLRLEGQ